MLGIMKYAGMACICLTSLTAGSQEVIHAMTGTVDSIDGAHKTFTLFRDNGTRVAFTDVTNPKVRIATDRRIYSDVTPASAFNTKGAYVIVFYFGGGDTRTAVAVEVLGKGPFTSTAGTVSGINGTTREVSVKDKSGSVARYKINSRTIAESDFGAVDGLKLHIQKGDHVRIVGASSSTPPTALFVNDM